MERIKKKKINKINGVDEEAEEAGFCTVTRDDEYLLTNALSLAREYELERQVALLFDEVEWEKRVRPKLPTKKKPKRFVGIPAHIKKSVSAQQWPRDFIFSWPIDRSKFWLSSLFGPRKMKNSKPRFHPGIDMAAHKGTPVKAAAPGIILESYWNNGYGNCIIIAHNKKYKTRYAHLNTRKVKRGQKVKRGELIGTVGDTGLVRKSGKDASHLHFEVYAFERHINPLLVLI